MRAPTPQTLRLDDYTKPEFTTDFVDLNFNIHDDNVTVISKVTYHRTENGLGQTEIILDAENPNDPDDPYIQSVVVDGWELQEGEGYTYDAERNQLRIPVDPDQQDVDIEITTHLEPSKNTELSGLYDSDSAYTTQCESEGFRRITPFLDRPDVMARYHVRIEADKEQRPVLLSNGHMTSHGDLPNNRHWAVYEDPWPKPSYLFATVNGNLDMIEDVFTTKSGRDVTVRAFTELGDSEKAHHALETVKKSMKWDEDVFDCEYDLNVFSIVAIANFNAGAMENKSLNIFRDSAVLASPEIATDANYHNIDRIVGHEYFHNYSGNRVTLSNWFHLTLKEGLTVNREQMFTAFLTSEEKDRINAVQNLRAGQFKEDDGPIAHAPQLEETQSVDNFYTSTVYQKGSEIIRMMKAFMGEEKFIEGVKHFFDTYDNQAVTVNEFIQSMEEVSELDFSSEFFRWYTQAGRPRVSASGEYDAEAQTYTLKLTQSTPPTPGQDDKLPLVMPVVTALIDQDGNEMPLILDGEEVPNIKKAQTVRTLKFEEDEQTFVFTNVESEPAFHSLFRDFSAPITLDSGLNTEQLQAQLVHDTDGFNRWDAGQKLALNEIVRLYEDYMDTGELPDLDPDYLNTYGQLLNQDQEDKALHALTLSLPSANEIKSAIGQIDPVALKDVAKHFKTTIVREHKEDFLRLFKELQSDDPYSYDYASVGERDLKRVAASHLVLDVYNIGELEDLTKVYWDADNMTDQMIAMSALRDFPSTWCDDIFNDFFDRFKDDQLTIQKWMGLIASSDKDDVIDRLDQISQSEVFNWTNPGHLGSLFGSFVGNVSQFHKQDGSGYRYFADLVVKLDATNPQTAARLVTSLTNWRDYTAPYNELMVKELDRIASNADLSPNVREKVLKSLPQDGEAPNFSRSGPAPT